MSIIEASKWGWSVIGEIPLTKRPEHLAITPNGRLAYVTLRDDSEIAVVDLLANLQIKIIPAGTRPIGIAINEDYVGLAANPGSNNVTVFNAKLAESSPFTIPVGVRPPSVAFSPEGDIAYVTNRGGMSLSVIDVFLHKVIKTIPVGQEPIGVAVTEDGRFTVVANAVDNTLSIIDNEILRVIYTVGIGLEPFWVKTVTVKRWLNRYK
jgi:YVTN family beta-propeller protein